ncbi:MAG: addiction module toxin RelE [Spirochaetes bacterium GWD1_27_9]|nr:MAG: addiction module toxin RelE [Spirochaetes bacterium GWD1_27_9]
MTINNIKIIEDAKLKYADIREQLNLWCNEVKLSKWNTPADIKNRYKTVSFLKDNIVIFNIKGNNYRLVIKVVYQQQIVIIKWVGTHQEYDEKKFE